MLNADTFIRLVKTRTPHIPLMVVIVVHVLYQKCASSMLLHVHT